MCQDCCCGTTSKHPDVDHDGLFDRLATATLGVADVSRSACLDACARSNVVVVTPSPQGRVAGGRPAWFMAVLTHEVVDDIVEFVTAGGPGLAEPNELLALHATYAGADP